MVKRKSFLIRIAFGVPIHHETLGPEGFNLPRGEQSGGGLYLGFLARLQRGGSASGKANQSNAQNQNRAHHLHERKCGSLPVVCSAIQSHSRSSSMMLTRAV